MRHSFTKSITVEEMREYAKTCSLSFTCKILGIGYNTGKRIALENNIEFTPHKLATNHERGGSGNTGMSKHVYQGKTLQQWSKITGVNPKTIRGRLSDGWSIDRAMTTKPIKPSGVFKPTKAALENREKIKNDFKWGRALT